MALWFRRRSAREAPRDFLVDDTMLAERFGALGEGSSRQRWQTFLAQRQAGDQVWCEQGAGSESGASAAGELLALYRPRLGESGQGAEARGCLIAKFKLAP